MLSPYLREHSGDYLYHHGILGQKWGIRRFQNKDGTRTALGKKREAQYENAFKPGKDGKASQAEKALNASKNIVDETGKVYRKAISSTKPKEDLSKFTDSELQKQINRMRLEQQYKDLKGTDISRGEVVVNDTLEYAKSVLAIGASAATIASVIWGIKHATG